MKVKPSAFSAVDWSEFHVWSPNGVYRRLKRDNIKLSHEEVTVKRSLGYCTVCLRKFQSVHIIPWPLHPKQAAVEEMIDTHRQHHVHHGVVQEAYVQFAAGALGGSTATYSTHWLDTVKVKMQTNPGMYSSGASCLYETFRSDGIRGLYQGAVPAVIGQTSKTAVVFMSYGLCEEAVRRFTGCETTDDMNVWHHAGSGAMTGIAASFVLCPLELVKCRLQALNQVSAHLKSSQEKKLLRSMTALSMIRHTLRKKGIPGLYRGLPGIWAKDVPGSFIYFGSYEFAKYGMRRFSHDEHLHLSHRAVFLCGMYAGLCYCVTHPIESVKTRIQVMSAVSNTNGFLRAFWNILRTEGIKPLLSGMGPSMVRACFYSGIQFVTYETVKEAFLGDN